MLVRTGPTYSTIDHQLQVKECRTYADEGDDLQDPQYSCGRFIRVR